jgi:single-strand DNA-binding protein
MASLNKVMLIGNAGRDAELRYMANGTAQASFTLAVNRNVRGQDGEWNQETDWFNIVAWRELAERLSQIITKGKQVYVEGRLQIRSWDNDQGVKQFRTEVIANQVILLGSRGGGEGGAGGGWGDDASFSGPGGGGGARSTGGGRGQGGGGGGWNRGGGGSGSSGGDIDPDDLPFE